MGFSSLRIATNVVSALARIHVSFMVLKHGYLLSQLHSQVLSMAMGHAVGFQLPLKVHLCARMKGILIRSPGLPDRICPGLHLPVSVWC